MPPIRAVNCLELFIGHLEGHKTLMILQLRGSKTVVIETLSFQAPIKNKQDSVKTEYMAGPYMVSMWICG